MQFEMFSPPWQETNGFMFRMKKLMSFYPFPFNVLINGSTSWSTNSIHTLVNMVIYDPTQTNLVSQVVASDKAIMMMTPQAKEGLYHDWHSTNTFLRLAIKIFECILQQANNFLHQCVDLVWLTKSTNILPLTILCAFYKQKVLIAFLRAQATSILSCIVVGSKSSSRLTTFSSFLSLSDMLLGTGGGGLEHNLFLAHL
jgi:hypothetical protein